MNPTVKEYAWSSFVTFVVAFGAALSTGAVPVDKATLFAVLATGGRAAVRAVMNLVFTKFESLSSQPLKEV